MKPGGEPQIVRASYDQILLKRLQEDIVGKAGPFLKDEDKHWWGEFFKSVNEQGKYYNKDRIVVIICRAL